MPEPSLKRRVLIAEAEIPDWAPEFVVPSRGFHMLVVEHIEGEPDLYRFTVQTLRIEERDT